MDDDQTPASPPPGDPPAATATRRCGRCGAENTPAAEFCEVCHALLAAYDAPRGAQGPEEITQPLPDPSTPSGPSTTPPPDAPPLAVEPPASHPEPAPAAEIAPWPLAPRADEDDQVETDVDPFVDWWVEPAADDEPAPLHVSPQLPPPPPPPPVGATASQPIPPPAPAPAPERAPTHHRATMPTRRHAAAPAARPDAALPPEAQVLAAGTDRRPATASRRGAIAGAPLRTATPGRLARTSPALLLLIGALLALVAGSVIGVAETVDAAWPVGGLGLLTGAAAIFVIAVGLIQALLHRHDSLF